MLFIVSAISNASAGRINVQLNSLPPADAAEAAHHVHQSVNLNFSEDEAKKSGYWPGARFVVTVEPEPAGE